MTPLCQVIMSFFHGFILDYRQINHLMADIRQYYEYITCHITYQQYLCQI